MTDYWLGFINIFIHSNVLLVHCRLLRDKGRKMRVTSPFSFPTQCLPQLCCLQIDCKKINGTFSSSLLSAVTVLLHQTGLLPTASYQLFHPTGSLSAAAKLFHYGVYFLQLQFLLTQRVYLCSCEAILPSPSRFTFCSCVAILPSEFTLFFTAVQLSFLPSEFTFFTAVQLSF